jgi:hypothetical protein
VTQAFGDPVDPGMLLILGGTTSMVRWPETLCRRLADSGLLSSDMTSGTPEPRPAMPPTRQAINRARTLRLLD